LLVKSRGLLCSTVSDVVLLTIFFLLLIILSLSTETTETHMRTRILHLKIKSYKIQTSEFFQYILSINKTNHERERKRLHTAKGMWQFIAKLKYILHARPYNHLQLNNEIGTD
jgi:hypothetical protein